MKAVQEIVESDLSALCVTYERWVACKWCLMCQISESLCSCVYDMYFSQVQAALR